MMTVTAIWRYPVKSMAGERVGSTALTETGLVGDRVVQVYDRHGRVVTARTFPRLLRLHATLGIDEEPLVDGLPWRSREVGGARRGGGWARRSTETIRRPGAVRHSALARLHRRGGVDVWP